MSTSETGISGSSISASAVQSRSITLLPAPLHQPDVLLVHRAATLPALEHLVPADLPLLVQPTLVGRVEAGRERHVDHVLLLLGIEVGRHLQADLLAEGHYL